MIFDPKIIDDLSRKLSESLPPGLTTLQRDSEQHINSLLQSAFTRLNLVSREEFDVQQAVLARTREKLEGLEHRLAGLEKAKLATQQRAKKKVTGKAAKSTAAKKTARKKVTKKKASKKTARKKVAKKQ